MIAPDHTDPEARHARLFHRCQALLQQLDRIADHDGLRDDRAVIAVRDRLQSVADDTNAFTGLGDPFLAQLPDHRTPGEVSVIAAELLGVIRAAGWWLDETRTRSADTTTVRHVPQGAYL